MSHRETGSLEAAPLASERPRNFEWTMRRRFRKPLLWIISAAVSCAFLVGVSAQLIDRPASTWVHQHLGDARFSLLTMSYDGHLLPVGPFSIMAGPAEALGPLALLTLALMALAAAFGWRPHRRHQIVMVLSLTVLVAVEMNKKAKWVFGRTWPESWRGSNPSWIRDGVFGFFPFHGGSDWGSFPSGHTTVITTLATLLWLVWPELRILWVAMVATVVTGLIGANYHFVSDVIGGLYLGVAVGLGGAWLMLSPKDRLNWPVMRRSSPAGGNSPALNESRSTPDQA